MNCVMFYLVNTDREKMKKLHETFFFFEQEVDPAYFYIHFHIQHKYVPVDDALFCW